MADDNLKQLEIMQVIGSNRWRANDQVMCLASEVDGKSFLVSDYAGYVHRLGAPDRTQLNSLNLGIAQVDYIASNGEIAVCTNS